MSSNPFLDKASQTALERKERITLLRRTHDIFCGIHGKHIQLKSDNSVGHTDTETFVSVPMEDDFSDLIHKHEWQHIFMGSDLRAREKFVKEYADQILTATPSIPRPHLEAFLHMFVNALDDLRVNDLWKRVYPQSAEDLEKRWQRIILTNRGYANDLIIYTMGIGLGLEMHMGQTDWSQYLSTVKEGLTLTYGYGGVAPMIAAKYILDRILNAVLQQFMTQTAPLPLPPAVYVTNQAGGAGTGPGTKRLSSPSISRRPSSEGQQQAQQGLMTHQTAVVGQLLYGAERSKSLTQFKDTQKPEGEDFNYQRTASITQAALGATTPEQIQKVLNDSKVDVEKAIQALLGKNRSLSKDQRLLKGLETQVSFRDVNPDEVKPLELDHIEKWVVEKLRAVFSRLMDKKRHRLSDTGSTINVGAYIDLLSGNGDGEVFEDEAPAKGFSALILLDMSGSMQAHWDDVSTACKVLAKALKFPFSKFEVWGFNGDATGKVKLFRFLDTEKGYELEKEVWGTTPLHLASEVAIRRLHQSSGSAQHLFIITDGVPIHAGPLGHHRANPVQLMTVVSKVVSRGRARGVNTLALIIGDGVPDNAANHMFGGDRHWARVEGEELFTTMVALVQGAFVSYLRRR